MTDFGCLNGRVVLHGEGYFTGLEERLCDDGMRRSLGFNDAATILEANGSRLELGR